MERICPKEFCTSCLACYAVCPAGSISVGRDGKGFYQPKIAADKCTDCSLCARLCPANSPLARLPKRQTVFAAYSPKEHVRAHSSSGGIFSHLAQEILAEGGVVFGAGFGADWRVMHAFIEHAADIPRFQGSKYVQSFIGDSFRQVRDFLQAGRKVLFSGTPCQIAGLNSFLQEDAPRLCTADLVCHGAPSPLVYSDYLDWHEQQAGAAVNYVNFRDKPKGWHAFGLRLKFANSKTYFASILSDPYIYGFLKNYYLSSACYSCKYANTKRQGDITLADFWGYRDSGGLADDDKGITLLITNTAKGEALFDKIKDSLPYTVKNMPEAVAGNAALSRASFKNRRYEEFWQDYGHISFAELIEKYVRPKK